MTINPIRNILASAFGAGLIAGCASTVDPNRPVAHVTPLQGSEIVGADTEYTQRLACLAGFVGQQTFEAPRVSVGHINDLTGTNDYFNGRRLTQGATLMAMTAIGQSGLRLVERYDMGIPQVELELSQSGLVRDAPDQLRRIEQGQIQGSDLYLVGGITEYNPNIRSGGNNAFANTADRDGVGVTLRNSDYIIDVGIDLRLIDVRSTEVVSIRAFRKQIRGREVEAGVFAFLDGSIIDIGGGERALEPVQTAVRSMIDRAVWEFVLELYNLPETYCDRQYASYAETRSVPTSAGSYSPGPRSAASYDLDVAPHPHFAIHLASYGSQTAARYGWLEFRYRYPELLGQRSARLTTISRDAIEPFHRLQAGAWPTRGAAERACRILHRDGSYCEVTELAGEPLG